MADIVGLKPQRFFFGENALQHSVTMLVYANPTGGFCILGLALYVPQLWTEVLYCGIFWASNNLWNPSTCVGVARL